MSLLTPPWKRETDAEFIESMRSSIETWHRWKAWLIGFWLCYALAISLLFSAVLKALLMNGWNWNLPIGLMIGFLCGTMISTQVVYAIHHILQSIEGYRTARLLVEYHDQLEALGIDAGEKKQLTEIDSQGDDQAFGDANTEQI